MPASPMAWNVTWVWRVHAAEAGLRADSALGTTEGGRDEGGPLRGRGGR